MNYQSNILLNGRGRGRGQRLPATSLSSHTFESEQKIESPLVNPFDINNNLQNEIIKIKNEINMQKQFNDKYHVRNSQQQFKDDDDSEDDLCKICERIGGNLICKTCGHIWKGRKRVTCPVHKNTLFLMDFSECVNCRSEDIKEV